MKNCAPYIRIIVLLISGVNPIFPSFSQTPVYYQFNPNNGLPSNEVYTAVADNEGYLWFGTDRGIARFDGKHFKLYTVNQGLGDNVVDNIFVSPAGKVWAFCLDKKLYELRNDSFVVYNLSAELKEKILQRSSGHVGFSFATMSFKNERPEFIGVNYTGTIETRDSNSSFIIHDEEDTCSTLSYNAEKLVTSFHIHLNPNVFVGTFMFEHKLYYNPSSTNENPFILKRKNGDIVISFMHWLFIVRNKKVVNAIFFENLLSNIYEDHATNLWICFFMKGVQKFAPVERISPNTGVHYFPKQKITGMVQDFEGGYWFTSYNSGVFYIPDLTIESVHLNTLAENEFPREITGNGRNSLYIVTTERRLAILKQGQLKELRTIPDTTKPGVSVCNDIMYDNTTDQIIISYSHGIRLVEENDPSFVLQRKGSRCVVRSGSTFFHLAPNVINYYINDRFYKAMLPNTSSNFYCAYPYGNNNIIIGTSNGLAECNIKRFKEILRDEINTRVNAIKQLSNSSLVVATLGKGIYTIDIHRKVRQVVFGDIVQQNMVNDLAVNGNIVWAATEKGVFRADLNDPDRPLLKSWSVSNGFPYNDIRKIYIQQGKVYVIAQNNLLMIDEEKLSQNTAPPRVFLNTITVNDRIELPADSIYTFSHSDNRVQFSFNGIAFKSGEHLRYRYRLRGFDDKWQTITAPFVEFPSLSYGSYIFELAALNESDIASVNPVVYSFTIPVPFWKRWWFYLCCIAGIFYLIWLIVKYRFKLERQRNLEREAMLQYEQQALSAQINPHFIFNALNSIQNFILQEDKRNAIRYLSRFSKLMRLNLDNARLKWIAPDAEIELIRIYLELEKLRFKNRFTYRVTLTDHPTVPHILIPSMLIQPFVENAILHGLNPLTDTAGLVEVDLQWVAGELICRIEDNGIGRDRAAILKQAHKRTHKGSGLTITRERLQLLCNETNTTFFLNVIDKKDDLNDPLGTIVVFGLPYKKITENITIN